MLDHSTIRLVVKNSSLRAGIAISVCKRALHSFLIPCYRGTRYPSATGSPRLVLEQKHRDVVIKRPSSGAIQELAEFSEFSG